MIALSKPFIRSWFDIKPGLLQGMKTTYPYRRRQLRNPLRNRFSQLKIERSVLPWVYPQGMLSRMRVGVAWGKFMKENWSSPPHASAQAAGDKEIGEPQITGGNGRNLQAKKDG